MSQDTGSEQSEEQSEQLYLNLDPDAQAHGQDDVNDDISITSDGSDDAPIIAEITASGRFLVAVDIASVPDDVRRCR